MLNSNLGGWTRQEAVLLTSSMKSAEIFPHTNFVFPVVEMMIEAISKSIQGFCLIPMISIQYIKISEYQT